MNTIDLQLSQVSLQILKSLANFVLCEVVSLVSPFQVQQHLTGVYSGILLLPKQFGKNIGLVIGTSPYRNFWIHHSLRGYY